MICDTNYILDPNDHTCPKWPSWRKSWTTAASTRPRLSCSPSGSRMLEFARDACGRLVLATPGIPASVPQLRRRAEINAFKNEDDMPGISEHRLGRHGPQPPGGKRRHELRSAWNPAKLEQRIARAWRKHQTRPGDGDQPGFREHIEHRMLDTLGNKRALSDGVLDRLGDLKAVKLRSGKQAFLARLEQWSHRFRPVPPPRRRRFRRSANGICSGGARTNQWRLAALCGAFSRRGR